APAGAAETAGVAARAADRAVTAGEREPDRGLVVIEARARPRQRRVAVRARAERLVRAVLVVARRAGERRAGEPERRVTRQARGGLVLAGQRARRERVRVRHLLPAGDAMAGLAGPRGAAVRLGVAH